MAVHVSTDFTDCGHELPCPHIGKNTQEFGKCIKNFGMSVLSVHSKSFKMTDSGRLRSYLPM
ncbi:MAG: hypothetical protein ACKO0V_17420, partial [bacterium]